MGSFNILIVKTPNGEIDFVAAKQNNKLYIQVTQEINSKKIMYREYDRLLDINDNYPKYLLRTDAFSDGNYKRIKTMHIANFYLIRDFKFFLYYFIPCYKQVLLIIREVTF